MAHVLPYNDLLKIAAGVGIVLDEVADGPANLYVIVDDQGLDLYVGKAHSERRHTNEDRWADLDHTKEILSGFVALWRENNASRRLLNYHPAAFDPERVRTVIAEQKWSGGSVDKLLARLDRGKVPTVEEVEQILIRIHIRAGRLIGNAKDASQWESPIGTFYDTMAALAVDTGRVSGVIPSAPAVTTEDPVNKEIDSELRAEGVHEGDGDDA